MRLSTIWFELILSVLFVLSGVLSLLPRATYPRLVTRGRQVLIAAGSAMVVVAVYRLLTRLGYRFF